MEETIWIKRRAAPPAPTYEDECFDSPPPVKTDAGSTTTSAQAVTSQVTVFTLDETGRPVGLGNQTWDSFRKNPTSSIETTSPVSESTAKGHGDIFDTHYPPTVSLSTGDRCSQLLEAKLGLDSALQTPKPTASNLRRQDRVSSSSSMGGRELPMMGSTPLVANTSSSSFNARHSYSSTSGTLWCQATSQISTPSLSDATMFSLKPQDSFSIERALHDPSQLQISPDLVAGMPDMARSPWQLPAQPQGQSQMMNGFIGQAPFAHPSQIPAMSSQDSFVGPQRGNQPVCEYDTFLRRRGPGNQTKKKRRQEPWESEHTQDAEGDDDADSEPLAASGQASHGGRQEPFSGYPAERQSDNYLAYMSDGQAMAAANAYWSGGRQSE